MKHRLKIIIGSTRPARKGPAVAEWIYELAGQHHAFETELIDLGQINLPLLDEEEHPRLNKYRHQHTTDWSARMDPADAFIFVTPEYNYGYLAPLKNALDCLFQEWLNKPAALVSYGGMAGGTRAVQQLRQVFSAFSMVCISESVNIPSFGKHIDANGVFSADDKLTRSALNMLNELARWSETLRAMRKA